MTLNSYAAFADTTTTGTTLASPAATTGSSTLDQISGILTGLATTADAALVSTITGTSTTTAAKPATVVAGLSLTQWLMLGGAGALVLWLILRRRK